jgi:hypothetical protein
MSFQQCVLLRTLPASAISVVALSPLGFFAVTLLASDWVVCNFLGPQFAHGGGMLKVCSFVQLVFAIAAWSGLAPTLLGGRCLTILVTLGKLGTLIVVGVAIVPR